MAGLDGSSTISGFGIVYYHKLVLVACRVRIKYAPDSETLFQTALAAHIFLVLLSARIAKFRECFCVRMLALNPAF